MLLCQSNPGRVRTTRGYKKIDPGDYSSRNDNNIGNYTGIVKDRAVLDVPLVIDWHRQEPKECAISECDQGIAAIIRTCQR